MLLLLYYIRNNPSVFIGIESSVVALMSQKGEVVHDPTVISTDEIVSFIKDMGFGAEFIGTENVKEVTIEFQVFGMNAGASSCFLIENALLKTKGILEVSASVGLVKCLYDTSVLGPRDVKNAIEDLGFNTKTVYYEKK